MQDQPRNDLERQILELHDGRISIAEFMSYLMTAQVFMPVNDKQVVGGLQSSLKAEPLSLTDDNGLQVLILFSSPDRAREFVKEFPGYGGGFISEFREVLNKIGVDCGIAINPGFDNGFDLEPGMLDGLVKGQSPHRFVGGTGID